MESPKIVAVPFDPVLDPRDPMPSARALVTANFTCDGRRTVQHYRGTFWEWTGAAFRQIEIDHVNAAAWKFLDRAKKMNKDGDLLPFQPSKGAVENVVELPPENRTLT